MNGDRDTDAPVLWSPGRNVARGLRVRTFEADQNGSVWCPDVHGVLQPVKVIVVPSQSTPLNPRKLLHSKWTAVNPQHQEKHFLVTGIVEPDPPGSPVVSVELEAVHSKRVRVMPWRDLTDATQWMRGWH